MKALENAPNTVEVTVYALVASRLALMRLIGNTSLPADKRAKYKYCVGQYDVAQKHIDGVIKDMDRCKFEHVRREFNFLDSNLYNCQNALPESPLPDRSPLVRMVMADRDVTDVALNLLFFID